MEIRQLRYFVEVCRTGSFTKAAENCFITAQGISTSLRGLEQELGTKLFKRNNKGVSPTPAGDILFSEAVLILSHVDACTEHFARYKKMQSSISVMFSVGTIVEFAYLPISRFLSSQKDSVLTIEEGSDVDCIAAIESGEVQCALCVGPVDTGLFDARLLFSAPNVLVVNEVHPLSKKDSIQFSDLKNVPIAIMRKTSNVTQRFFTLCEAEGFTPTVEVFVHDARMAGMLVGLNKCCAVMGAPAASHITMQNVKAIPFSDPSFSWNIYLIKPRHRKMSNAAKSFEKMLIEHSESLKQQK